MIKFNNYYYYYSSSVRIINNETQKKKWPTCPYVQECEGHRGTNRRRFNKLFPLKLSLNLATTTTFPPLITFGGELFLLNRNPATSALLSLSLSLTLLLILIFDISLPLKKKVSCFVYLFLTLNVENALTFEVFVIFFIFYFIFWVE